MKTVFSAAAASSFEGCVLALGKFDGVHLGHQRVLAKLRERAWALGAPAAVLTFDPLPKQFFCPGERAPLQRLDERLERLEAFGVELALVLRFDAKLAALTPEQFSAKILCRLKPREVVVGSDFCFGRERAGAVSTLTALGADLGFEVRCVPLLEIGGRKVGSTEIRNLRDAGLDGDAKRLLGG